MDINQAKTGKTEHESGKSVKSWSRKAFFIFELELSEFTLEESYIGKISPWIYFSKNGRIYPWIFRFNTFGPYLLNIISLI